MKLRRIALALAAAVLGLSFSVPASAAELVYVSGPGEIFRGYTMPVFVIAQGTSVKYLNLDIAAHSVTANGFRPAGQEPAWCGLAGYAAGQCPWFDSTILGLGGPYPIYGMETTPPGQYPFFCANGHTAQKGLLVVV